MQASIYVTVSAWENAHGRHTRGRAVFMGLRASSRREWMMKAIRSNCDRARTSDRALIHLTDTPRPIERTFEIRCVRYVSILARCFDARKLPLAAAALSRLL